VAQLLIRRFHDADWPALWPMLRRTIESGATFAYAPMSTEAEIRETWIDESSATYVCESGASVVGTYYIKPNQPGRGSHVCNCGYLVAPDAEGQGVASAMCEHSQAEAIAMGFSAMQFNLVVATNERAVRLWQRLGFSIVGRLPRAFRHEQLGLVDAFVMYKELGVTT
jgi:ribosomal protein S18 acetylase RimI-like enzyme